LHIAQKPHLSVSPVKEPSLKVPFMESNAEKCPTTIVLLHSSKSPVYELLHHLSGSPQMEKGPHGERCPYPETFLTYLPGSPVKELPLEAPSKEPLQREALHPQSPLHQSLKVPGR